MNNSLKLKTLDVMYNIYDTSIENLDFACEKHCSYCCSCNLTATTLEACRILSHLKEKRKLSLIGPSLVKNKERFIPSVTVNEMAEICSRGEDIPEENVNHKAGKCQFLSDDICSIYEARPFNCRCMLSTDRCAKTGYAVISPYLLTVHNIFTQYIEHLDSSGYTSNLTDMLLALSSEENIYQYENGLDLSSNNLVKNKAIHTLMIPPEHIKQIQPLLENIRNIKMDPM